jgi:polysaccharide export outer membrane protein
MPINRAGGPFKRARPHQLEVVVRRHGQVILTAQYSDLLAGGDIGSRRTTRSSCGPTRAPSPCWELCRSRATSTHQDQHDPARGLGQVGGLTDERANKTGVFVFRMGDIQNNPGPGPVFFGWTSASRCLSS